jgi:hypothetical protein
MTTTTAATVCDDADTIAGLSNAEITERLVVSEGTVKKPHQPPARQDRRPGPRPSRRLRVPAQPRQMSRHQRWLQPWPARRAKHTSLRGRRLSMRSGSCSASTTNRPRPETAHDVAASYVDDDL